ncbi:hypothetical protein CMALT394_20137 [Carnobacterium maltaromaticum]|nr:hypothetical protein CMALT394_20137 [Carnobacterium maltaromaticum]
MDKLHSKRNTLLTMKLFFYKYWIERHIGISPFCDPHGNIVIKKYQVFSYNPIVTDYFVVIIFNNYY